MNRNLSPLNLNLAKKIFNIAISLILIFVVFSAFKLTLNRQAYAAANTIDLVLGQVQKANTLEVSICIKSQGDNITMTNVSNWLKFDKTKLTANPTSLVAGNWQIADGYSPMKFENVPPAPVLPDVLEIWTLRMDFNSGLPGRNIQKNYPELFGAVSFNKIQANTAQNVTLARNQYFYEQSANTPATINVINTNKDCRDSDGDTLFDDYEISKGLNPGLQDTEGDGLLDGFEVGSNLNAPIDTDGDTIIDALESALLDADADGVKDQLDPANNNNCIPNACDTKFNIKVNLSGVYNTSANSMRTALTELNILSVDQLFKTTPFNYNGSEIETVNLATYANVVDWVLVEFKNQTTGATDARAAGLLLKDGNIIQSDGLYAGLKVLGLNKNNAYHVIVKHRNHLAISTNTAITLSNLVINLDFTTNQNVKSANQKLLQTGKYGLIPGNPSQDGSVDSTDRNLLKNSPESNGIYSKADLNLDGVIDASDRNLLKQQGEATESL